MRRAAFLDRDGTIIEDAEYLADPAGVRLVPGAARAIRLLNAAEVLAIVVTNQSAIARGWLTEETLTAIHERMRAALLAEGGRLDDILYCPHLPEGAVIKRYARNCSCRKPEPGMMLEAARRHGVDLARSVAIGDAARDVEAGRRAGCRTVFIRPRGKGVGDLDGGGPRPLVPGRFEARPLSAAEPDPPADYVAKNLLAAVRWFLTTE